MSLSPSITEWEAKTKPINKEGQRLGPRFLVSPWLFDLYSAAATAEEVNSMAHMVAVIDSVEVATTAMTGERWYRCQVDCGLPLTLALPIDTYPAPSPGAVIEGAAMLTGTTGSWVL